MDEPQLPAAQLSINVNFNNLRGKLGSAVDRYARLVSIGIQAAQEPIREDLRMPGTGWSVSFSGAPPWSEDEARQHYSAWLFATGLRDALEAFGAFLDECYDVASIMRLIRKNKETGQLLGQDWFDHQSDTGSFRQFGIDKKLKKLKPWFQTLTTDLQESIRSINRGRNILAHHEGSVPDSYLDENGKFRISWIRLTLTAMGPEAREVVLGETLKAGEGLGLLAVSEHRDFGKGERLYLQPVEFSGICWTIFTAGDAIREALEKDWVGLQ
jgi:hypothetical protein